MSETNMNAQISGAMLLFQKPELLNKEQHGDFGLKRIEKPYSFCASVRAVPVTVSEISMAMKHYPIVFSSTEKPTPYAVVGVIDDLNLFVDENGQWEGAAYIPGYVRRYPFAVASDSDGERMAIVIDAAHPGIGPNGEAPLFKNGEPTDDTQRAIEFCRQYEADRRQTEQLMTKLAEFELIVSQTVQYTPAGQDKEQPFAQYFAIDEKRLQEMPDEQFLELRRSGALPFVYAQLFSYSNWRPVMGRRAQRFNLTDATLLEPQLAKPTIN